MSIRSRCCRQSSFSYWTQTLETSDLRFSKCQNNEEFHEWAMVLRQESLGDGIHALAFAEHHIAYALDII